MGVEELREIAVCSDVSLSNCSGRIAAVDALNWIIEYERGVRMGYKKEAYTTADGKSIIHLLAVLRGMPMLLRHNISPVFAFDGDMVGSLKLRNQSPSGVNNFRHHERFYQETIHELLTILDVPYFFGVADGEAEASTLVTEHSADFVLSNDLDTLLFGSPITIRLFTGDGPAELVSRPGTLDMHDIDGKDLVDIALAIGTDYNEGIETVGASKALEGVKKFDSLDELARQNGYVMPDDIELLRDYFLDPPTMVDSVDEVWFPKPNLDDLYEFLYQFSIPEEIISNEIYRLKQATTE